MHFLRNSKYSILTVVSIIFIGLINLPTPLFGDQAFFLLGAKEMNEGLVLYRDFWDIKQPGIFYFFLAGGKLFGFTEIGIHLFELFYWVIFSITLLWFVRRFNFFVNQYLNYLLPVMVVGTYYAISYPRLLTQVEALVSFPLLLVIIFNYLFLERKKYGVLWLFLSGLAGGCVLFFKLMFAPLLVIFWLILLFRSLRQTINITGLLKFIFIPAGIFIFWLPFLFYCYYNKILGLCYTTFFQYPPLILKYAEPKSLSDLLISVKAFFLKVMFLLPLSLLSILFIRKCRLSVEMFGWFIIGLFIILIQRNSWYSYHFQLLFVPIIFMSLNTIDNLSNYKKFHNIFHRTWLLISLLVFLNCIPIFYILKKCGSLSKFNFALNSDGKLHYALTNKDNAKAYLISNHIKTLSDKCPIFVINDPLVYYYTGRNQAIAQSGWSMQLFVPGQWETFANELKSTSPCLIFIRKEFETYFETKDQRILQWIRFNYSVYHSGNEGIWYKLK